MLLYLEAKKVVADHVWFSYSQGFIKASISLLEDALEFEARVKEYRKGYVNKNYKIINNPTTDFNFQQSD